jgi:very-short-patch-repair endonuclease
MHQRQEKRKAKTSEAELFEFQCRAHKLPAFVREAEFAKQAFGRRWRFDFCWEQYKLAAEIEGIVMRKVGGEFIVGGRHGSIAGFIEDCDKYNHAALLGWTVLRFAQKVVKSGEAINMTMRVLHARGWKP